MPFDGTPRPPARWTHAVTELDNLMMVTYRVDPDRLRALVDPSFEPTVFAFDDGAQACLVSAVPFLDRDFHFRSFPVIKVACGQVNYRAYGSLHGEPGVWFFGTSLDSVFVVLPQVAWRMPWHRGRIHIDANWDAGAPARVRLTTTGRWGTAACELVTTDEALGRLDGFDDADATKEILTHPMVGWYRRRDGRVGRYTVWHEPFAAVVCQVDYARFEVFEQLGLVAPGAPPHSAFAQRTIHFDVHTPPGVVRG